MTKIKGPSGHTKTLIDRIIRVFIQNPDATWHPSLFTTGSSRNRAHMAAAIRWLKKMDIIQVAYRNADDQPIYAASSSLKRSIKADRK